MPSFSATSVSVPLSGVTKYCPFFVWATTDLRLVPTPGSTTETNTVPAGQYGAVCHRRYDAFPDVEGGDLVRQVVEFQVGIDPARHALHLRHRAVLRAEVALEHERRGSGKAEGGRQKAEGQQQNIPASIRRLPPVDFSAFIGSFIPHLFFMRFTEKIRKAFTAEGMLSVRRGIQRAIHPQPVSKFLGHLDPAVMQELAAKHGHLMQPGENWAKYLDAARWLKLNIRRAQDIGVDRVRRPLRVLDLGSGAGWFLFVCKHLGHEGLGIDVPHPAFYGEIFEALGLQRVVAPVDAQKPLPDELLAGGKFDLVTAFSIEFNKHAPWGMWQAADWDYLLNDLRDRFLQPGGRVYFDLNPNYDGQFMTPDMAALFQRRGASVDRRSKLMFDPLR